MRLALIAPFGLIAKGTTRARVLPLARELARRGHEVALFIPPYDSPEDSGRRWREQVDAPDRAEVRNPLSAGFHPSAASGSLDIIHVTLPRVGAGSPAWHVWLGWRLWCAVAGWQPEIAHVFKPKGPSGLAGTALWLMRQLRNCRVAEGRRVITVPSRPLVSLSGPWPCLLVTDSDDWEGPGGWNDDPRVGYSPLQRRFFAWQERFGLSHADAWTVTSECLRQRAMSFGADPARVFLVPNGVLGAKELGIGDWEQENPQSLIPDPQPPAPHPQSAILYTRFAGVRSADVAAIWGRVHERMPAATLTVVGRGVAGEEQALIGVPGVEVRGWVQADELPALFAADGAGDRALG